jgi:hypothetical protein
MPHKEKQSLVTLKNGVNVQALFSKKISWSVSPWQEFEG